MISSSFKKRLQQSYQITSDKAWYHGSSEELPLGKLKRSSKSWKAFDGKVIEQPFWLTSDFSFAKLHGKKVYKCSISIPSAQIFGDRPLVKEGRYWSDMAINEGKLLYEALDASELFADAQNYEEIFRLLVRGDYDVVETKEFIDWAQKNGFRAAYITGDGPRNLVVFDPTDVTIEDQVNA